MLELPYVRAVRRGRMIKRKIAQDPQTTVVEPEWLRLEDVAEVEITSEASEHPIEHALVPGSTGGWRAESAGRQIIRVNFEPPRAIRRVRLSIEEHEQARTQELLLRAATSKGGPWREVVRQQFNFSPAGATREEEDYRIDLPAVASLELTIVPEIGGGDARASLQQLRIAG